ncbi:c-type cytochrome [Vibrio sp. WXL103]|uniref:c-type cytochrome n=1 Tax=Vibrio sp. WXL103 TaxID=3450710 RepID=UPI003EC8D30B
MRLRNRVAFLGVGLFIAAIVYRAYDAYGGDALAGQQKYLANCQSCHGVKGFGDGEQASDLANIPRDLEKEINGLLAYDSIVIPRLVLDGKTDKGMPAFRGQLSEQDVKDIFAYIRQVNKSY